MSTEDADKTHRVLLSAPRRSNAICNSDGTLAAYTVSSYSFGTREKTHQLMVMNLETRTSTLISDDPTVNAPQWLPGRVSELAWLQKTDRGHALVSHDVTLSSSPYEIFLFPGPVSDPKFTLLQFGDIALVVSGQAGPSGKLYDPETAPKPRSSARIYSKNYVRHWDQYVTEQRNALFFGIIRVDEKKEARFRRWTTALDPLRNVLADTKFECPVPPYSSAGDYDLGASGLVFCAKDPELDPSSNTKMDVLFVTINDLVCGGVFKCDGVLKFTQLGVPREFQGAASSPRISPDGGLVAFLKMRTNGYESDQNVPMVFSLDTGLYDSPVPAKIASLEGSASALTWLPDSKRIILEVDDAGETDLYLWTLSQPTSLPLRIPRKSGPKVSDMRGCISGISVRPFLAPHSNSAANSAAIRLLISSSSYIDSSTFTDFTASPSLTHCTWTQLSSLSANGARFKLHSSQVQSLEIPCPSNLLGHVPCSLLRPSHYNPVQRYPLALLIHGGPQGAWTNAWSTRWNPAVFAEAGYMVLCPNITGSSSYGQAYVDAIAGDWGGQPYADLVACFEHAEKHMPDVDTSRAVALGASYGGFMVNFIQGMPLGRKFCALVTHDGIFSTRAMWETEELYFPEHDFGGLPWDRDGQSGYARWDPAAAHRLSTWATPQLVVHSDRDYRLPVAQGIAAFNVLQRRGVESRFVNFPDEGHWVLKEENSLVWHREVLGWINGFVGLGKPDI